MSRARSNRVSRPLLIGVLVLVLALIGAGSAFAAPPPQGPPNDNFAGAIAVTGSPFVHKTATSAATTEQGEPQPSCGPTGRTVWYSLSVSGLTDVRAHTAGSTFDTVVALYTGSNLPGLTEAACNDDASVTSLQSNVTFAAQAGTTYYLQVGGYAGGSGTLKFTAELTEGLVHDNFVDAIEITTLPFARTQATGNATVEPGEPSGDCFGDMDHTVWFKFAPTSAVVLVPDINQQNFHVMFNVWKGTSLSSLELVTCEHSTIAFSAKVGETYYFQIGSHLGDTTGTVTFSLTGTVPPPNDDFANAVPISDPVPYTSPTVSNQAASLELGEPTTCSGIEATVWYRYTPSEPKVLTANTFSSNFDTVLAVFVGNSLDTLVQMDCNDQFNGNQSQVTFVAVPGQTYHIQVGGWLSDRGNIVLRLEDATPGLPSPPAEAQPAAPRGRWAL